MGKHSSQGQQFNKLNGIEEEREKEHRFINNCAKCARKTIDPCDIFVIDFVYRIPRRIVPSFSMSINIWRNCQLIFFFYLHSSSFEKIVENLKWKRWQMAV